MTNREAHRSVSRRTVALLSVALVLPVGLLVAYRLTPPTAPPPEVRRGGSSFPAADLPLEQSSPTPQPAYPPRITNVQIVDFDRDGQNDILCCDARRNRVIWYRQTAEGKWNERVLADEYDLAAPCHATVVDLDQDEDLDVVVSVLGSVWPTDDRVGRVVWLENTGENRFKPHVILDDVRRVTDAQAGDLDEDGDLDLVIAEFGFLRGRILWLEQRDGRFHEHELSVVPGTIHVPIADYDGDGDLDVLALVSQDEEEIWAFENVSDGEFQPKQRVVYSTVNFDLGTAGMVRTDLDQDGDQDLLLAAGDNLDLHNHYPQPWHGCIWLENQGDWQFAPHRIAHFGGTYAAAAGDLDADGDQDVVLVSIFNDWKMEGAASVVWLENDGQQQFRTWQIADRPTYLATVDCGDLNGDGRDDIVAGGLHLAEPFDRLGDVTAWVSH
jgi:hypothetical protein